jgi:FxsC-like protein
VQYISYKAADSAKANYVDVPVDNKLIEKIRAAERDNTVVVLVVDPWSVKVQTYRQLLETCDSNAFLNCGIVIPWNTKDDEPDEARAKLTAEMKAAFKRTLRLKHIYFRDSVQTAEDLEQELCKAILEIRTRLMQETPEVRPAESAASSVDALTAVPVIHGPGAEKP